MLSFPKNPEKRPSSDSDSKKLFRKEKICHKINNFIDNSSAKDSQLRKIPFPTFGFNQGNSILLGKQMAFSNTSREFSHSSTLNLTMSQRIQGRNQHFSCQNREFSAAIPLINPNNYKLNSVSNVAKPTDSIENSLVFSSQQKINNKTSKEPLKRKTFESAKQLFAKRIDFVKQKITINENKSKKIAQTALFPARASYNHNSLESLLENSANNFLKSYDCREFEENENEIDRSFSLENNEKINVSTNDLKFGEFFLKKSVFENRPQTIFFKYPAICDRLQDFSRVSRVSVLEAKNYDFTCRISNEKPLKCVELALKAGGFNIITESKDWNIFWGFVKPETLKTMNPFQKTNHFPGCWHLGRKDNLYRHVFRMKQKFEEHFDFIPKTYLLSSEYKRFLMIKKTSDRKALWIMKPVNSSCGRGIKVISQKSKIPFKKDFLVSEYINNPHLINDLKYDLRVYVVLTSFDPLRVYCYQEGLVRFATEKFSLNKKKISKRFIHLTNFSVNKKAMKYQKNVNCLLDGEGNKWSFSAYRKKLQEMGIDPLKVFNDIYDLIVKVCISTESYMSNGNGIIRLAEHRNNCFELFGFDILIDSNLKPWLMEVNVSPSLSSSSPLDAKIKTSLISDMLNLVGFKIYDKKKIEEEKAQIKKKEGFSNEISDLSYENCLEKLSVEQWNVLFESEEEFERKGEFIRLFPDKKNLDYYCQFFQAPSQNNLIWWKYLKANQDFLELKCKREKNQ